MYRRLRKVFVLVFLGLVLGLECRNRRYYVMFGKNGFIIRNIAVEGILVLILKG